MCRRYPDTTACTVLLIRVLLWMFLAKYSTPQEFPSRDTDYAFGINQRHLFYDTNAIPDGLEVTSYLFVNTSRRYFFQLDRDVSRLDITVTPCASPIVWQVTHKPKRKYEIGNDVEKVVVGYRPAINTRDALYTLSGEAAETLQLDSPARGIYSIEITSTKSDSYVSLFATTSPYIDRLPELPADTNVRNLDKTYNRFTVSWLPSPDERTLGENLEYCVAINRRRSYQTLCAVLSHLNGDPEPTVPSDSGFGFASETQEKRYLRQKAKPVRAKKRGSIFFQCIGKKTKATFENVKTRKGYHVDVFVRNTKSNGRPNSRHYRGIYIRTKRKRRLPKLRDGKIRTVVFSRGRRKRSYSVRVNKSTRDVNLAISSCSGTTIVEVIGTNGTIFKSRVKRSKVLTIPGVLPGSYIVALSKSVSRKNSVYLSFTAKRRKLTMPKQSSDKSEVTKIYDNLTTCNSVTVGWKGTDTKQFYCLYRTELPAFKSNSTAVSKKLNECGAMRRLRDGAQKITCKKFKSRSKDSTVLAITVAMLKPATGYIFDVFVNKGQYFTFPYISIRTKTLSTCYLPT